jgi:hypothetical protein
MLQLFSPLFLTTYTILGIYLPAKRQDIRMVRLAVIFLKVSIFKVLGWRSAATRGVAGKP